jgi:hypothetical protein
LHQRPRRGIFATAKRFTEDIDAVVSNSAVETVILEASLGQQDRGFADIFWIVSAERNGGLKLPGIVTRCMNLLRVAEYRVIHFAIADYSCQCVWLERASLLIQELLWYDDVRDFASVEMTE